MRRSRLIWLCLVLIAVGCHRAPADAVIAVDNVERLDLKGDDVLEVAATPSAGFNFPYYVFVPNSIDKSREVHFLVEPNNTGSTNDDFEVHRRAAMHLAKDECPNKLARKLGVPLLVPVFPRPKTNAQVYTQDLDRETLEIAEGPLNRIDLQLAAMIDHAIALLRTNGFKLQDKVFMDGFSASSKFCNRFAFLHPERVKAVATGGVNALPTLPLASRNGQTLPFPIGIADIDKFTGRPYGAEDHQRVAQYVYMGYFDRNDTLPFRDAWSEEEAEIIKKALPENMMPDRWNVVQAVYRENLPRAQCVTYNGVGHAIKPEMLDDLVKFFKANSGEAWVAIEPHLYPFVEELRQVHITAVYTKGGARIPESFAPHVRDDMFLLVVKEWVSGVDYHQLDDFIAKAGFNFRLHAEGYPDIVITQQNWRGNCSTGRGDFQAQYLEFEKDQLDKLVRGVPYTLQAENKSDKYYWIVEDGVTLTRPAP